MSIAAEEVLQTPQISVRLDSADAPAGENEFFRFCFDTAKPSADSSARVPVPLTVIGGNVGCEIWNTAEPVVTMFTDDLLSAETASLLMLHVTVPVGSNADIADSTYAVYQKLLSESRQRGFADIVRTWNYIPEINAGDADAERYRQFSIGRARALEEHRFPTDTLPAGTAIGGVDGTPLGITLLAANGDHPRIENPRQISAYEYPRQYGPKSPSFSRAVLLKQKADSLLVSGTASIVGHESVHTSELENQAIETANNIISLRETACAEADRPAYQPGVLRVYVRHADDAAAAVDSLAPLLRADAEQAGHVVLRGDICRSDLLLEVEAVYPLQT